MIAIVDYGVGNLFSLKSSLAAVGAEAVVTGDAETLRKAVAIDPACADEVPSTKGVLA